MFLPASWACWVTQSIAAITWETSAAPSAAPTLTLTMRASGATPTNLVVSLYPLLFRQVVQPVAEATAVASRPAMMLAMWVPCPKASTPTMAVVGESKDRSGPSITLPEAARPGTFATPVSMTATSTPWPVYPRAQADWAPTIRVTADSDPVSDGSYPSEGTIDMGRTDVSGLTDRTPGTLLRCGTAAEGTSARNPSMIPSRRRTRPPDATVARSATLSAPGEAITMTRDRA
jgi:hypothetical protein